MYRLAIKARKLRVGDAPNIEMLDESDNVREGFIEPADFECVLAALKDHDVRDAARYGYLCAWRRGEVLSLQWRDVTLTPRRGLDPAPAREQQEQAGSHPAPPRRAAHPHPAKS